VSATFTEERLLVDDVVTALTSSPAEDESPCGHMREQMERAAEEVDRRTAEAFGRALVDSLCEDPGDVRRLEALLILGLAHPHVLEKYQVSLGAEGRRLCVLLENDGQVERARGLLDLLSSYLPEDRGVQQDLASMMRRAGDVDELVERCLQRADEAVREGKPMEAIPWLQEILLHDQTRRDIARMIRDLRYQEMANVARVKRRNRLALLVIVVSTMLSALFVREVQINNQYDALPPLALDNLSAVDARLESIDELIASNRIWFGMFDAVAERSELQAQKDRISSREAERARKRNDLRLKREAMAEALRLKALDSVEAGEFEESLAQFREALELSSDSWSRRSRVAANIAAIEKLLEVEK